MKGRYFVAAVLVIPLLVGSCQKSDSKPKPPEIFRLSPNVGRIGDVVTLYGRRFSKKVNKNKVFFYDGVEAKVLLARADRLTVLVPPGASTGAVTVERVGLTSNGVPYTILVLPTITALVPDSGPEGTLVRIEGSFFGVLPQDNLIDFAGRATPTLTATSTELTCFVPPWAVSGNVSVQVGPDRSNSEYFEVTTPRLWTVEEFFGAQGSAIVLSGEKFSPTAAENIIRFGGIQAPVTFSSSFGNSLSTVVPPGSRSGEVTVEVTGGRGTTNGMPFCLEGSAPSPPAIASLSPNTGAVGDSIQINGFNFSTNASDNVIRFDGILAQVISATAGTIQTEVPTRGTSGLVTVEVAGQRASWGPFTVTSPAPPLPGMIAIDPPAALVGDWVVIRGSDFSPEPSDNRALFAGVEADVIGASADALMVWVPFTSGGPVTVEVGSQVTPGGLPFTVIGPAATTATFDYFGTTIPAPSDSVIFVIDISGTMNWTFRTFTDRFGQSIVNGSRLDYVKDRTAMAIDALPTTGTFRFNVVAYDCSQRIWSPGSQVVNATSKFDSIAWVNALLPSGSSDTGRGGSSAIIADPSNLTLAIVSDGSPTCGPTSEASHLCEILTVNFQGAAVHTFAIDGFGDFVTFMQDLAALTGGTYQNVQ